jgi:hypothetical protein
MIVARQVLEVKKQSPAVPVTKNCGISAMQVLLRGCLQAGLVDKALAVTRCAYHLP